MTMESLILTIWEGGPRGRGAAGQLVQRNDFGLFEKQKGGLCGWNVRGQGEHGLS